MRNVSEGKIRIHPYVCVSGNFGFLPALRKEKLPADFPVSDHRSRDGCEYLLHKAEVELLETSKPTIDLLAVFEVNSLL